MHKEQLQHLFAVVCAVSLLSVFAVCSCSASGEDEVEKTDSRSGKSSTDPNVVKITLQGDKYSVSDESKITRKGGSMIIKAAGDYELTGTLDDGQIIVDVAKTDEVKLILNGVDITCETSAAIYVDSADKVIIELAEGSVNNVTDGESYKFETADQSKPNAAIYGDDDLTFKGNGALFVYANYNNGIGCKNDLKITSGELTVRAVKNAIKGNDSVSIEGGKVTIASSYDGIESDSADEGEGYVEISGGTISISSEDDAIQAVSAVTVTGGKITVDAGGRSVNCAGKVSIAEGSLTES